MKDQKDIDRLFQEKLKNFEATPDDSVWEKISSDLYVERKGRKAPMVWWRLGGIAAGLLLLFALWQILDVNKPGAAEPNTTEQSIVDIEYNAENGSTVQDVLSDEASDELVSGSNAKVEPERIPNLIPSDLDKVPGNNQIQQTNNDDIIVNSVDTTSETKDKINNPINKKAVANGININTQIDKGLPKSGVAIKENKYINDTQNSLIKGQNKEEEDKEVLYPDLPITKMDEALSTKVEESDMDENPDSNPIEEIEKSALTSELVANEEPEVNEEVKDFNRWSAAPVVGPVYFNTLGSGSSIHPDFNNNSKTGDINLSYGITASYAINRKLSVRAGVHKVNLGYSTNNVVVLQNVGTDVNTPLLRLQSNIKMTNEGRNLAFIDVSDFNFSQVPEPISNLIRSSIDQELGFIEIPLELRYKISSRKIGINVIGGFSTLILSDNEVYSVNSGGAILLGKATNLNNTSFSANFGLGFDFRMSDNINLILEPLFKYQLNTFTNTAGNFKPYVFGVYSGLSFKF
jgi:hypothetical protein